VGEAYEPRSGCLINATLEVFGDRWTLRHRPTSRALRVRAELPEQGGPALWEEFMDELRRSHLDSEFPARSPSVRERLNAAYLAATNSW
jgi:hypothetical protein